MMKRAAFEKVSMFSEEYFMYAEDVDLCYKSVQAGYKNYYTGEGRVLHYGGKSSESDSATRMKWRAIPRFCEKHRGRFYGLAFRAALASASDGPPRRHQHYASAFRRPLGEAGKTACGIAENGAPSWAYC